MRGKEKRIFKPDWMPESGEDRSITPKHGGDSIGNTKSAIQDGPIEFKEKYKRVVIPGTQ